MKFVGGAANSGKFAGERWIQKRETGMGMKCHLDKSREIKVFT
jgi:hypothetical protein